MPHTLKKQRAEKLSASCNGGKLETQPEEDHGILGPDREIPEDHKVMVTDIALDSWIAAHYGMTLDRVPPVRPPNMAKYVHRRMRMTRQAMPGPAQHAGEPGNGKSGISSFDQ